MAWPRSRGEVAGSNLMPCYHESSVGMLQSAAKACMQGGMQATAIIVTANTIAYSKGQVGAGRTQRSSISGTSQFIRGKIKSHKPERQIRQEMSMGVCPNRT